MAFGLYCYSPMDVCSFVFSVLCLDCITTLGWFLSNEDGVLLKKKKLKQIASTNKYKMGITNIK
jgi:hypothetical protein